MLILMGEDVTVDMFEEVGFFFLFHAFADASHVNIILRNSWALFCGDLYDDV